MPTIAKAAVKKARIEIIPLIDVVFFLLATFVLFTLSLNKINSIPLDLPKATPAAPSDLPDIATIQVSDQGTLFWDREIIGRDELPARLAFYKQNKPDPRVLIAGDDKALYGVAIEVMDAVRLAGIYKVSIETRVRPTGR
ncbi:MAG TPA: biopolymer transporter ExbD [Opitutaceae bacterium]